MSSDHVLMVRQLNIQLEHFLETIQGSTPLSSSEELAELLKKVVKAGARINQVPRSDPAANEVLRTYRLLLERLKGVLPVLEVRLRMERAQLESQRSQLTRATHWTAAAKTTLPRR